jgi:iron complex transport system ATP-binding protein
MRAGDAVKPTLELTDVAVARGGRTIIDDIDLVFPAGRLTVLLGPNGAGKSTVVKAASGEWPIARGMIRINGRDMRTMKPQELARIRAVVPQATVLASPFTVLEVVQLGVTVPGFGLATDPSAGLAALAQVGLEGFEDRLYTELSGGERQRVHIARAFSQLASAPGTAPEETILLLDEPTSSLDPSHQVLILEALREQAGMGRTVIAVMHDLNLASAWADHIVMMRSGRLIASGSSNELFRDEILSNVYSCRMRSNMVPQDGRAFVLPHHTSVREERGSDTSAKLVVRASRSA